MLAREIMTTEGINVWLSITMKLLILVETVLPDMKLVKP